MNPRQIDRFFQLLAREFARPATIIMTGAAAGSILGHIRPSRDIDFALILPRRSAQAWAAAERAIAQTERLTGIAVNYAEDIDRWSQITFLNYQRHSWFYRRFGTLQVRVMDPLHWSIGKVSRHLLLDERDLVAVLRQHRPPAARLVRLWATALRRSPRSPILTETRRRMEWFVRTHGRTIWGPRFDPDQALRLFNRSLLPRVSR